MNPCSDCHAGCCRSFAVPTTGADILRIERAYGLNFWDIACRWEDKDDQIAQGYAPHFHFDDEPATKFVICLKHESSAYFPETPKCQFLHEEAPTSEHPLGTAFCSIHAARPGACRVFPTKMSDDRQTAIVHFVPEFGRQTQEEIFRLCPRPWTADDVDPVQTIHDLVVMQHEMNFFHMTARAWNRDPQPWALFPEFLSAIYENRVAEEAEPEPVIVPFPGVERRSVGAQPRRRAA